MQPIQDAELLQLWELSAARSTLEKSLLILAFACPEQNAETLATLSIGERDARLLRLRELMFGPLLHSTAHCPQCSEKVEWDMPVKALQMQEPDYEGRAKTFEWRDAQWKFQFRLPNSTDIMAVLDMQTTEQKSRILMRRCLIDPDADALADDLPESVFMAISEQMAAQDPQAEIEIDLNCPRCGQVWSVTFDITQYLWQELNERAMRLLQEVCILARYFGWSERDILLMNRHRRDLYLNMLRA